MHHDRLDRHDELIGKIFSKLSRLEADLEKVKAWQDMMIEDTRRLWDIHLPDIKNWISSIENGIEELKGLLPLVQEVQGLRGEVEEAQRRLSKIEKIKDVMKARFDSQTEWRKNLGRIGVGAILTVVGYGLVELLKWVLKVI